ncbi:MAG TPA: type II toxin-antitoxin system HicA family toxin [Bacteroidota bacterium]|nr:type II toxin-antitoxin system HicA family toxin [Bacteroidota bacterium]
MPRTPRISGTQVIRALRKMGFQVARTRGSHQLLTHPDGRRTVVPVHSREMIGPGLLAKILRDCDLTPEELRSLL